MDRHEHEPGQSILLRLEAEGKTAPRMRLKEAAEETPPELKEIELRAGERYEVLGEIARGGVGQVVKGRDVDLGRDVAMKILLDRHLEKTDLVRRFVEEAQIGGQLQHPGIVPVYELGLDGKGRPFFAMKLVKGQTLAELIRRRSAPDDDLPRFLGVFLSVCRCIAYAHSRGVIHRDLKPSNVMVGAFGEVQVLDWGFAKVLERGGIADERRARQEQEDITRIATLRSGSVGSESLPGSVLGTPAYMPPEQALGQVEDLDERSDVFSLGAILCEILTGRPPYLGDAREQILAASRAQLESALERLDAAGADPELTRLAKSCLAALRKDRPQDASDLAVTVDRYLTSVDEREHRSEVAAAKARAGAAEAKARTAEERAAAEAARAQAEEERERSRTAKARAEAARAEAEAQRRARRQTRLLAAAVLLALVVGAGGLLWARAEGSARVQRAAQAVNAALEEASRLEGEGKWAEAVAAGARAAELARAQEADEEVRARAESRLAELRDGHERARAEEARRARDREFVEHLEEVRLRRAIDLDRTRTEEEYQAAFASRGLDVDRDSAETVSTALDSPEVALEAALTLDEWSWFRRRDGREGWRRLLAHARVLDPDPLRNRLRDAVERGEEDGILEMLREADPETMPIRTLDLYANLVREQGDAEAALELLLTGHHRAPDDIWINSHISTAARKTEPPRPGLALRHASAALAVCPDSWPRWYQLASGLRVSGRKEEAAAALERCRELGQSASNLNDIGALSYELGDLDRAERDLRRAIELEPDFDYPHANLALVHYARGEIDRAVAEWKEAIRLAPKSVKYRVELGTGLYRGERYAEAAEVFRTTLVKFGDVRQVRRLLAASLENAGRYEEAVEVYRTVLERHPEDSGIWYQLGRTFWRMRSWEEVEAAERRALEIYPDHSTASYMLGLALWNRPEPDRRAAVEAIERAVGITPGLPNAHYDLAFMYRQQGRFGESLAHAAKAAELSPDSRQTRERHGFALWIMGDAEGALREYRKAGELDPAWAEPYANVGAVLNALGDHRGAEAAYREAVKREPENGFALFGLGDTLAWELGRYEEGLAALTECSGLPFPDGAEDQKKQVDWALGICRFWVKLSNDPESVSVVLAREATAEDTDEMAAIALFCQHRDRPADAVHYYRLALDGDLEGEPGPVEFHRAARSAARAAAGIGEGLEDATDQDRKRWRADAVRWVRAGLESYEKAEIPEDGNARIGPIVTLENHRLDPALAPFREGTGLGKLPFLERRRWLELWEDLDAALRRYRGLDQD